MASIGNVTKQQGGGFKGELTTLNVRCDIDIVPNERKKHDDQPDYRVFARGVEIGAGWLRIGDVSKREYVSLSLAAPELGERTLYANLGPAEGEDADKYVLIWNPPRDRRVNAGAA